MSDLKPYYNRRNLKHGCYKNHKHLYGVWSSMRQRCYNENRENFARYGGRGITICEEWSSVVKFVEWALNTGYQYGLQLVRIDNNKGYSPDNCRWVTPKCNSQNTRRNKYLCIKGITNCVSEWSRICKVSKFTIYWWIKNKGEQYAIERISKTM